MYQDAGNNLEVTIGKRKSLQSQSECSAQTRKRLRIYRARYYRRVYKQRNKTLHGLERDLGNRYGETLVNARERHFSTKKGRN